jgi:hypothetical protein
MLCGVARSQGSIISLRELLPLLPESIPEGELAEAICSFPDLSSRFELRDGYVRERLGMPEGDRAIKSEVESRRAAVRNLSYASQFISLLHSNPFVVVAVGGSTSYNSASRSRDLDLFCVAPVGKSWLSLVEGLLMSRVFAIFHRGSPGVCFSCVMAEDFAMSMFAKPQEPLFARDALQAKVFRGSREYESLLRQARWISSYYPQAYGALSRHEGYSLASKKTSSIFWRVLNKFLFLTVGRYVAFKAWLLNRKLLRMGREHDAFTTRCSEDHLIYESRRYSDLRLRYSDTFNRAGELNSATIKNGIAIVKLPR